MKAQQRDQRARLVGLLVAGAGSLGLAGHLLGMHFLIRPLGLGPEPSLEASACLVLLGMASTLALGGSVARGVASATGLALGIYGSIAAYRHGVHLFAAADGVEGPWGLEVGSAVCFAVQGAALAITALRPTERAPIAVASTLTLGLASTSLLAYSIGVQLLRRYGAEMPFLVALALALEGGGMLAWAWYSDVAETRAPMPTWSPLVAAMSAGILFVGFTITVEGNSAVLQVLLVLGAAGKLGSTVHERLKERRADLAARQAAHVAQRSAEVRTDEAVAQRRRLETILDLAPVPLVMVDPATSRVSFANEAADALAGGSFPIDEDPEALVFADALGRPLPDAAQPVARVLRGERLEAVDVVALTRSGRRELLVDGARLPPMDGEPPLAVLALQDITRLRRAEQEMERLGRIVDDAPTEVYAFDATTLRIVQENAAARRNLGYRSDELASMTASELVTGIDAAQLAARLEPLRTGELAIVTVETQQRRKDGTTYPVEARIQLSRAETTPVFVALVHNISERKRTEAERARLLAGERRAREEADAARERLAFIASASRAMAEPPDLEGTLRAVARAAVPRLSRWCVVFLSGDAGGMRRVAFSGAEDGPLAALFVREAATGASTETLTEAGIAVARELSEGELWDVLGLSSDDARREALALGVSSATTLPLRGRGTTLGALVLIATTSPGLLGRTSELALAEEFAARAALAIHDARLYEDAKAALRARDEFLVVASHDLRMPLSLLEMQIESMQRAARRVGGGAVVPVARLPRFLDGILRLAKQLSIVVEDVLDPSRLTGAHMKLALEELDLAGLVCTVVARFGDQLAHAGSRVVLSANETAPGEWDRFRLEQVVAGLLSNAIESGPGKPIEVSVDSDVDRARVLVRDHGRPLTDERQAQLFSLEERAVSARHYGGAGLGLFLVRRIVDALGGTIDVETHAGDGTSFTVSLPRRQHQELHAGAAE